MGLLKPSTVELLSLSYKILNVFLFLIDVRKQWTNRNQSLCRKRWLISTLNQSCLTGIQVWIFTIFQLSNFIYEWRMFDVFPKLFWSIKLVAILTGKYNQPIRNSCRESFGEKDKSSNIHRASLHRRGQHLLCVWSWLSWVHGLDPMIKSSDWVNVNSAPQKSRLNSGKVRQIPGLLHKQTTSTISFSE